IHPLKYKDKAVKSIPKRVTNISDHLLAPLTIEEFTQKIMEHVLATTEGSRLYTFTEEDIKAIGKIRDEKYATREWNYGYSPSYSFKKAIKTSGGMLEMNLEVQKGEIKKVKIFGDFFNEKDTDEIERALVNVAHDESAIRKVLGNYAIGKYFTNMTEDDLMEAMF
ncbi:MAG TPA: lipoate protein ligase C-terminal domain-containing protein, partial [Hanamia sp.]|nr:lipoate protein ligase C-terminal domain-containing protein [Hanamia sp.]